MILWRGSGELARRTLMQGLDGYVDGFVRHLADIGEAPALFGKHGELEQAKRIKREHLIDLASGDYGKEYVQQRIKLGMLYSRNRLETRGFVGAFHQLYTGTPEPAFQNFLSLTKIGFFDIAIISDVLIYERGRTISLL
jgi:hypothetical protein